MDHDEEIVAYRFRHKGRGAAAIIIDAEGRDFPDPQEWQREEGITITRSSASRVGLDSRMVDELRAHSFIILAQGSSGAAVVAPRKDDRGD